MQQIPHTDPADLKETVEDGEQVTLVDVRTPREFRQGTIEAPSAETVNVPLQQIRQSNPEQLLSDVPTDDRLIMICNTGSRSKIATQIFNRAGIDAVNLRRGMVGWSRLDGN